MIAMFAIWQIVTHSVRTFGRRMRNINRAFWLHANMVIVTVMNDPIVTRQWLSAELADAIVLREEQLTYIWVLLYASCIHEPFRTTAMSLSCCCCRLLVDDCIIVFFVHFFPRFHFATAGVLIIMYDCVCRRGASPIWLVPVTM